MLQSLDEYNRERSKWYLERNSDKPKGNGIACPECSEELFDTNPSMELLCMPPKKDVYCVKCGFKGMRIA